MPEGKLLITLKRETGSYQDHAINSVAFSPDGKYLASADINGGRHETSWDDFPSISLWNVPEGTLLKILEGHYATIMSVAFSPDGKYLASGSHDCTIKIWNMPEGTLRSSLEDSSCEITRDNILCRLIGEGERDCTCDTVCTCNTVCTTYAD
jgi:WD40 repeat protein